MANSLIMSYVLRKFKNARSSSNNRWFAYVNKTGLLTTRGLANHMIEHGMTNKAEVLAVCEEKTAPRTAVHPLVPSDYVRYVRTGV